MKRRISGQCPDVLSGTNRYCPDITVTWRGKLFRKWRSVHLGISKKKLTRNSYIAKKKGVCWWTAMGRGSACPANKRPRGVQLITYTVEESGADQGGGGETKGSSTYARSKYVRVIKIKKSTCRYMTFCLPRSQRGGQEKSTSNNCYSKRLGKSATQPSSPGAAARLTALGSSIHCISIIMWFIMGALPSTSLRT